MKPLNVSIVDAAAALGVTSKHISGIVNGRARVTADMAIRLSVAFETEPQVWVNLQAQHDLWVALLESAVAAGEIRNDVESDDLLHAVASLCMPAQDDGRAQRMVALLVDGLRCGMRPSRAILTSG